MNTLKIVAMPLLSALFLTCLSPRDDALEGQQPTLPNTAAGRQLATFLKALNSQDEKILHAFIETHFSRSFLNDFPTDEHVKIGLQFAKEMGELVFQKVEKSEEYEISALAQANKAKTLARIELWVEASPPHAISSVGFTPGAVEEPPIPKGKLTETQILLDIKKFLNHQAAADNFSGAVLVARDGKPLFEKAYGLASKAFHAPNHVNTRFNLGSMNKMITAVAIAQLAEQGKLSYADTIGKHLPDFPNQAVRDKVTLHHLLSHTSGMGDYFNDKFIKSAKDQLRNVQDYFPLFVNEPLSFEPGQKFQYSNSGYMVLGAVIERISGQSYFDYVREHIYKLAGMTDTDAYEMDQDTPNLAIGYTKMGQNGQRSVTRRNNLYLHVVKGGPAGGGFSTVHDLLKFAIALRSGQLMSKESFRLLTTPKSPGGNYGYGFVETKVNGERIVGHSGGFPGISADLDIYCDSGYTVVVLSNYDGRATMSLVQRLRQMLTHP